MARSNRQSDRQVEGIPAGALSKWNRRRSRGPAVRHDRGGDAAAARHVAGGGRPPPGERAFATRNAKAVALVINSPGGSPVQSRQIYLRIRQLAAEKKLPVLVFVEDVAASGGYMIACAGDEIFCDPSSILGSIGVVGGSFGFQDLIKKVGVERRLYTAGGDKGELDPFLPENPDDVARVKALQREIHAIFIALVRQSRGTRLKGTDDVLFTGEYWAGETSVSLGLADAIGDLRTVLRARYGDKVKTPVIAPSTGLLSGLLGRKSAGATT